MTRWFRVYDDILDDPKVQLLSPELFKTWVNLLAVASRNAGKLPPAHQLAFALRLGAQDMQSRLDELILAGLIDIAADGSMEPHNWSKRQWKSDDSAERVRKHRAKKSAETSGNTKQAVTETDGNDGVTVTVTSPDTESESDTERRYTPLPPKRGGDPVELYEAILANSPKAAANSPTKLEPQSPSKAECLQAFADYNATALRCGLPQASRMTPDRERKIRARLKDYGPEGWSRALANVEKSKFLTGSNDRGWRANLDFLLQPTSFAKVHDGVHGNAKPASTSSYTPKRQTFVDPDEEQRRVAEMARKLVDQAVAGVTP